ncbi:MAG: hypothetical protein H0U79_03125 [Solirubrobacterales bacterium]|nr:hypothetical protein [Solirubrobacterales bacterium]
MEYYRKQAKALVRNFRAGRREAIERAEAVLGERARERFLLGDAQYVIAREHGQRTWRELACAHEQAPSDRLGRIRGALDAARASWGEVGEVMLADGVRVRKRGHRYRVDDRGEAVARAGSPPGWLAVAERVVELEGMNVSRRGVVFVPAVEGGLDLASLALRIADTSDAVYVALLELDDV